MSHIEDALSLTGWGLYSKFLIGFASACYFTNGLAFMGVPLYLTTMSCDMPMTNGTVLAIALFTSLGSAFGAFFISATSDVVGRKSAIILTLIISFTATLSTSFVYSVYSLMLTQFILAVGSAANAIVVRIHLAESLPIKGRSRSVAALDIFWSLGCVFATFIAMGFLPLIKNYTNDSAKVVTWRVLYAIGCLPHMIVACVAALVLQSPRFLIYERKSSEALAVLNEIYAVNNSDLAINYTLTAPDLQGKIADYGLNSERDIPNALTTQRCMIICRRIQKSLLVLTKKTFVGSVLVVSAVRLATCFGLFTVSMYLSKASPAEKDCRLDAPGLLHFGHPVLRDCEDVHVAYQSFLVLSLGCIVGQVCATWLIGCVERKYLISGSLFLSGGFTVLLAFVDHGYWINLLVSVLVLALYAAADVCLNLVVVEMFPTAVRGTAYGETYVLANLAELFVKVYIGQSCFWIFIALAVALEGCLDATIFRGVAEKSVKSGHQKFEPLSFGDQQIPHRFTCDAKEAPPSRYSDVSCIGSANTRCSLVPKSERPVSCGGVQIWGPNCSGCWHFQYN